MGTYNSFYDSSNLESPIQKYYDEKYVYKLSNKPWVSMDIIQTDVVYTTGEVQSIYETGDIISTEYFNSSSDPTIAIFEFFLSLQSTMKFIKKSNTNIPIAQARQAATQQDCFRLTRSLLLVRAARACPTATSSIFCLCLHKWVACTRC